MTVLERQPKETAREYARRVLIYNIVNLELEPGCMMSEQELSEEIHLSRTPVREALLELSKDQIVEILPQRGSRVALINYDLVAEARFLRLVLENAIVKLACEQADALDFSRIEENLAHQKFCLENGLDHRIMQLDNEFHYEYFRLCNKLSTYRLMQWDILFSADGPAYRQLAERIARAIAAGELKPGCRLPAERRLSRMLAVSRGTVRAAYQMLEEQGLVYSGIGAGTYVKEPEQERSRRTAELLLDELWKIFDFLELSAEEIEQMVKEKLWKRVPLKDRQPIAWTECNPELLELTARQITETCGLPVSAYLLHDVLAHPEQIRAQNPLIAVPVGHHEEVQQALPDFPVELIAMRISNRTISYLSLFEPDKPVAIVYESERFLALVHRNLDLYHLPPNRKAFAIEKGLSELAETIADYGGVIFPMLEDEPPALKALRGENTERGIRWVPFEYLLDRGSLMHLEEYAREQWFEKP